MGRGVDRTRREIEEDLHSPYRDRRGTAPLVARGTSGRRCVYQLSWGLTEAGQWVVRKASGRDGDPRTWRWHAWRFPGASEAEREYLRILQRKLRGRSRAYRLAPAARRASA